MCGRNLGTISVIIFSVLGELTGLTGHLACLHLWLKSAVFITQVQCPKGVIKILNYFQSNLMEGEGSPLSHYTCLTLCLIFCFIVKVVNCGAEEPETTHPNFLKTCLLPFSRNYIFWSSVSVHSQHLGLHLTQGGAYVRLNKWFSQTIWTLLG